MTAERDWHWKMRAGVSKSSIWSVLRSIKINAVLLFSRIRHPTILNYEIECTKEIVILYFIDMPHSTQAILLRAIVTEGSSLFGNMYCNVTSTDNEGKCFISSVDKCYESTYSYICRFLEVSIWDISLIRIAIIKTMLDKLNSIRIKKILKVTFYPLLLLCIPTNSCLMSVISSVSWHFDIWNEAAKKSYSPKVMPIYHYFDCKSVCMC